MDTSTAIFTAGLVAQKLHRGQTDKGGNDYFTSHLLKVASRGNDWKEIVVGFLHDTTEDCNVSPEEVMTMLEAETSIIANTPEKEWRQPWMENLDTPQCKTLYSFTDEERNELSTALRLLNHHTSPSREEYILRISDHPLALNVKLNDLENNMDISRIPHPTPKDHARIERYKSERQILMTAKRNK